MFWRKLLQSYWIFYRYVQSSLMCLHTELRAFRKNLALDDSRNRFSENIFQKILNVSSNSGVNSTAIYIRAKLYLAFIILSVF